jgi:broad specificity phosphatase PhoE
VQRILQGQQDGELTELGIDQAEKLGKSLRDTKFNYVYCSDLKRCRDTLARILTYHNIEPTYDPRLREKHAGVLEGAKSGTSDKLAKSQGIPTREFRPEGGESWTDVQVRARDFLIEIATRHLNEECKEMPRVLVVSHGGWIMEFMNVVRSLRGQPPKHANVSKNTALYVMRVSKQGSRFSVQVIKENDISHLEKKVVKSYK